MRRALLMRIEDRGEAVQTTLTVIAVAVGGLVLALTVSADDRRAIFRDKASVRVVQGGDATCFFNESLLLDQLSEAVARNCSVELVEEAPNRVYLTLQWGRPHFIGGMSDGSAADICMSPVLVEFGKMIKISSFDSSVASDRDIFAQSRIYANSIAYEPGHEASFQETFETVQPAFDLLTEDFCKNT